MNSNKKSKASNKKNNNNKRKQKARATKSKFSKNEFKSAPAAVSDNLQQYIRFGSSSTPGGLAMHVCAPIYQIGSMYWDGTNLSQGGIIDQVGGKSYGAVCMGATSGFTLFDSPVIEFNYITPVYQLIAFAFTRYKITKLKFYYEPQSPTTTNDRLVFTYANDPDNPVVGQITSGASSQVLLAIPESYAFAPWNSWSLDCTRQINQNLLYTDNTFNETKADDRFSMFGIIGCVPSVFPDTTPDVPKPSTIYGILYMETTIEFQQFCPIVNGVTPSLLSRVSRLGFQKPCNDKDCKKCTKTCDSCQLSLNNKSKSEEKDSSKKKKT